MPKQTVKEVKKVKVAKATDAKSKNRKKKDSVQQIDRHEMIARQAYLLAEQRGFQGGDTVADWLQAEAMIDLGPNVSH